MGDQITWKEENWPVSKLRGNKRNPRKITPEQFDRLKKKISELGYHHPVAIQPDGLIISGHQRVKALLDLGYKEIRVSIPSRPLDKDEYRKMMIEANVADGDWDKEILSEDFEAQELEEWGLSSQESGLFTPGDVGMQGKLDESQGKIVQTCPNCQHTFTA